MYSNAGHRMTFFDRLSKRSHGLGWCLFLLLVLYVALLLYKPDLSPSDEYAFLPTLQSGKLFPMYGKDFPYYDSTQIGRFGPLGGQEYNLVALFTHQPLGYFALNALELIALVLALVYVLNSVSKNRALNYLAVIFLFAVPALTNTYFKLLYIEKNVATLLAMFLAFYIAFQRKPSWWYFLAALLTANLAIYYKEPVFIIVGTLCAAHLWFTWRRASWRSRALDLAGMASSVVWIALYLITVLPNRAHAIPSGYGADGWFVVFAKTLFNYGFFSDPLLILIVLPLFAVRAYQIFVRRRAPHLLADPMLAAAAAYIGVFFVLNLYSPYYLLPAYVLVLPALCYFIDQQALNQRVWKVLAGLTALAVLTNALPMALHYLTYNKYLPINFNATVDTLVREVESRYHGERVRIFFDGVDRGNGRGVYFIVGEFLRQRGLSIQKFDLASDVEARDPGPFVGRRSPFDSDESIRAVDPQGKLAVRDFPFTVFQPGPLARIERGDILVVSPQSTKWTDAEAIERLKNEYDLVFASRSPWAMPSVNTKAFLKYALMKRGGNADLMVSQNIFSWPDYYVFVKR